MFASCKITCKSPEAVVAILSINFIYAYHFVKTMNDHLLTFNLFVIL